MTQRQAALLRINEARQEFLAVWGDAMTDLDGDDFANEIQATLEAMGYMVESVKVWWDELYSEPSLGCRP